MAIARETVRLGLGARAQAKIKVRQPLARGGGRGRRPRARGDRTPGGDRARGAERAPGALRRGGRRAGRIRGQGQLPHAGPAVRQRHAARGRGDRRARPGARGGGAACAVASGIGDLRRRPRAHPHRAGRDPHDEGTRGLLASSARARTRSRSSSTIDDSLLREGRSREIVHAVQNARKSAGLEVEDRIELVLGGDQALMRGRRASTSEYVSGETLAVQLALGEGDAAAMDYREQTEIEGQLDRPVGSDQLTPAGGDRHAIGGATLPRAPTPARPRSSSWGRPRRPS